LAQLHTRTCTFLLSAGLLLGVFLLPAQHAAAAEFRSVAEGGAIMYDAPSARAKKLFIARRYYPLAVLVNLEQWSKVRDAGGDLSWVEKRALSDQRMVMVAGPRAIVRSAPEAGSKAVFDAERDVALELMEIVNPDWVRVREIGKAGNGKSDGQSGYVRASDVWGL
jgi:SH3-like domain-containing protein